MLICYVRTQDNAWLETTALHFPCNAQLGEMLHLQDGNDEKMKWLDVDLEDADVDYANLDLVHKVGALPRPPALAGRPYCRAGLPRPLPHLFTHPLPPDMPVSAAATILPAPPPHKPRSHAAHALSHSHSPGTELGR